MSASARLQKTHCPTHSDYTLQYISFNCKIHIVQKDKQYKITQHKKNQHPTPAFMHHSLNQSSIIQLQQCVLSALEAESLDLKFW